MDRRTRICIWVILLGLANFLAYVVVYIFLDGEAARGHVEILDGQTRYVLQSGKEVSYTLYLYSGIHSISIWVTVGAIMLAMLTLAKERIASSMRSTIVRGRTLITILATLITVVIVAITVLFIRDFCQSLREPIHVSADDRPAVVRASHEAPSHVVDG